MSSPTPSRARSMLSDFGGLNDALSAPFAAFLRAAVAGRDGHARFLNLLSLLEHIGSRKIMLSQMKGVLTQDILKHLAEETRHAFFFKREAEKLAGRTIDGYAPDDTLAAASGRLYFGRLDAGLTRGLAGEAGYLWVSLIVELRALWVYRLYQQALDAAGLKLSLRGVIAEEDRHLEEMIARLDALGFDADARLAPALALEQTLFRTLLAALQAQAAPEPNPA